MEKETGFDRKHRMGRLLDILGRHPKSPDGWRIYDSMLKDAYDLVLPVPSEAEVDLEAGKRFDKLHAHPGCREYHRQYGAVHADSKGCQVCGFPMACGGMIRTHKMKAMSQDEKARWGFFTSAQHHVFECKECGYIHSFEHWGD